MTYRIKNKKSYMNKDWLHWMYVEEKLSESVIAHICDTSQSTIHRWLNRFEILIRDTVEERKLSHWLIVDEEKQRKKIERIKTELALKELDFVSK